MSVFFVSEGGDFGVVVVENGEKGKEREREERKERKWRRRLEGGVEECVCGYDCRFKTNLLN